MPLLSPNRPADLKPDQINKVLKTVRSSSDKENFKDLLDANGVGAEDCIQQLGSIIRGSEFENNRLRAIELGVKLNGLLKDDEVKNIPVVNIIINDSEHIGINPILIPRTL